MYKTDLQKAMDEFLGQSDLWWKLFTVDTSDEQINEAFNRQFGRTPEKIVETGGGRLAGPLTKAEVRQIERSR